MTCFFHPLSSSVISLHQQVKWFSSRFVASRHTSPLVSFHPTTTLFQWGVWQSRPSDASACTLADYSQGPFGSTCFLSIHTSHKGWMSKASSIIFGPLPIVTCQNLRCSHNLLSMSTSSSRERWVFLCIFSSSPPWLLIVQRTLDLANAFFSILIRCAPSLANSLSYYYICNHDLKTQIPSS